MKKENDYNSMDINELKNIRDELEQLKSHLESFKETWNDLEKIFSNLSYIDCNDYIALTDEEGNEIYPFHISFDEIQTDEWVDSCVKKIRKDSYEISKFILKKDDEKKKRMINLSTYFCLKYNGNFNSIYLAICNKEPYNEQEFKEMLQNVQYEYMNIFSDNYLETLNTVKNPPFCLFIVGNKKLLNNENTKNLFMYPIVKKSSNKCRFSFILNEVERDNNRIYYDYVLLSESHDQVEECVQLMKDEIVKQHIDSGYEACFIDEDKEETLEMFC